MCPANTADLVKTGLHSSDLYVHDDHLNRCTETADVRISKQRRKIYLQRALLIIRQNTEIGYNLLQR